MIQGLVLIAALTTFSNVKVDRVYDGDTFIISLPGEAEIFGENLSVRVKGIDTPEVTEERACIRRKAKAAKDALATLLGSGDPVNLTHCERDKYFRILCFVNIGGSIDVSEYLLEKKLALPYGGRTKLPWDCQ